jgi:hypothetical protein
MSALYLTNRFDIQVDVFLDQWSRGKRTIDDAATVAACDTYMAALFCHRDRAVEQIRTIFGQAFNDAAITPYLDALQRAVKHQPIDSPESLVGAQDKVAPQLQSRSDIIVDLLDLARGESRCQLMLLQFASAAPSHPQVWQMYAGYRQLNSGEDSSRDIAGAFYDTLQWLYPDEPAAKAIIAQRPADLANAKPKAPQDVLEAIKDIEAKDWPDVAGKEQLADSRKWPAQYEMASAVHQALQSGDTITARQIALRAQTLAIAQQQPFERAFAGLLLERVEDAEHQH